MVYYDPGSLPFLVDELIAMATVEIVVTPTSPAALAHDKLAPAIRKRVRVLSTASQARRRLEGFLSPLNAELGSEIRSQNIHIPLRVPQPVRRAVGVLYFFLYDFLLAMEHQLQVEIDLPALMKALTVLRSSLETPEARAHIAQLEGIFSTYVPTEIPKIELVSITTKDHWRVFERFVEDAAYNEVARSASLLGIPAKLDRATTLLRRAIQDLVSRRGFQSVARLGTKVISTATSLPDASDLIPELRPKGDFIPPIVSLEQGYAQAARHWRLHRTPFVESDESLALLGPGWVDDGSESQPSFLDFAHRVP